MRVINECCCERKKELLKTAERIPTSRQGRSFCETDECEISREKAKREADVGYVLVGGQRLCVWESRTAALLFDKW